jgi:hypothetical protein
VTGETKKKRDGQVKPYTQSKCAIYLILLFFSTFPKVKMSNPIRPCTLVFTEVAGSRIIQEISQIGKRVIAMTRRKRTKK